MRECKHVIHGTEPLKVIHKNTEVILRLKPLRIAQLSMAVAEEDFEGLRVIIP